MPLTRGNVRPPGKTKLQTAVARLQHPRTPSRVPGDLREVDKPGCEPAAPAPHLRLRNHRRRETNVDEAIAFNPADRTSAASGAICFSTRASNSRAVMTIGSTPSAFNLSRTFGSRSALKVSSCSRPTMSRGVFAGTNMPTRNGFSALANPASDVVGTSGRNAAARLAPFTRKRRDLAVRHKRQSIADRRKEEVDPSGNQLFPYVETALEWDMHGLDAGA